MTIAEKLKFRIDQNPGIVQEVPKLTTVEELQRFNRFDNLDCRTKILEKKKSPLCQEF